MPPAASTTTTTIHPAMQGVLQSGCYYVPIDEQMPEARMRSILGQVHAPTIVSAAETVSTSFV